MLEMRCVLFRGLRWELAAIAWMYEYEYEYEYEWEWEWEFCDVMVWFGLVWFILVGTFSSMYYFIRDFYTLTVHAFLLFILVRCVFLLLCIRL
mmetsp:Transcript_3124/g.6313  ORF Transcript_3124/g.6313 Transcript_3124/m.6313 type:complete len:93 (-) Transcript_3124:1540-1818(-)